jgi:Protein of unknown function (DUF3060)
MSLVNKTRVSMATCLVLSCLSGLATNVEAHNRTQGASINSSNFKGELSCNNSPLSVAGSNCTVTISDAPIEMTVDGSNNELKIPSGCLSVKLNGSNNTVYLGLAQRIVLIGSNNTIRYANTPNEQPPSVENQGANNKVTHMAPQAVR